MRKDLSRLKGKRTIITGAGSGIGKATATLYAREGAKVGRRLNLLEEVAAQIRADGRDALVLPCDVSKEPEIETAFMKLVEAWGGSRSS